MKSQTSGKRTCCRFVPIRFSLRAALILLTIIGVFAGWFTNRVHQQKKAIAWIESLGGDAIYRYQSPSAGKQTAPTWAVRLFGIDYFATIETVNLKAAHYRSGGEEVDLSPLRGLPCLRKLCLTGTRIKDITPLSSLRNLTDLNLGITNVSNVMPLKHLSKLANLDLSKTDVEDLTPLSWLDSLHSLNISQSKVSELKPLESLRSLKRLTMYGLIVSDGSTERLQQALPACKVQDSMN